MDRHPKPFTKPDSSAAAIWRGHAAPVTRISTSPSSDVVALRVEDVAAGGYTADRAMVRQKKTGRAVRFELSEQTRQALDDCLKATDKRPGEFLFTGHRGPGRCMTTRQYARLVSGSIGSAGLDPRLFGTHSLRRTKLH
jgi:integrase